MHSSSSQDDPAAMYHALGTKEYRKELDRQFKTAKSNFRIAIVVDMWLTGFDVPFLDTMYIDKPIQRHNLIQTISRVNRKVEGKNKGLIVDYIGIKKQMNLALAHYNKADTQNFGTWRSRSSLSGTDDIKAELKVDLILLLGKYGYPPVDRDEVYQEISEQAENFKKYRSVQEIA